MFEVIYLLTYFLWKIRPLFPLLSMLRPLLSLVWNLVIYQGVYWSLLMNVTALLKMHLCLVDLQRSLFYISIWPAATRPVPIVLGSAGKLLAEIPEICWKISKNQKVTIYISNIAISILDIFLHKRQSKALFFVVHNNC